MNTKTILLLAAVQILLTGCAAYSPQTVDVPLIQGKGDIRIDAGLFLIPNTNDKIDDGGSALLQDFGVHGTFTAGLTDHVAVQTYVSMDMLFRGHIQGALGLYNRFENNSVIEMYGGYGYGENSLESEDSQSLIPVDDNYSLVFTQFNWGRTDLGKRHLDFGMGLKGGYVFTNTSDYFYMKDGWIVEPTVFFRFGGNRAKFSTKVNYMWTNSVVEKFYYYPVSVSFGVNFHAGKRYNKR